MLLNMRNYLRNNFHNIRLFTYLLSQNSVLDVLKFMILTLVNVSRLVPLKVENVNLELRTSSTDLTVAASCLKDQEFIVAKEHLNNVSFVVDAGGYIGTAAIAFHKMFPNAKIVTVEASETNFAILKKNVAQFPQITAINKALTGEDTTLKLFDQGTGNWGFSPVAAAGSKVLQEIQGISIPTLLKEYSQTKIDVMKLDIEGGEKDVLDKSSKWIQHVDMIIAELHDDRLPGCESSFNAATQSMKKIKIEGEKVVALRLS